MARVRQVPVHPSRPGLLPWRRALLGLGALVAWWTLLGGAFPAGAEDFALAAARKKMLIDYRLTLEKVDKIRLISKKLATALRADPQIGRELHAVDAEKGGTFAEIDEEFARHGPHLAAIIQGEGLGPGDYFIGFTSVVNASLEASDLVHLPDYIPRANVELARKNKAEFDEAVRSIDEMDAAGKAVGR